MPNRNSAPYATLTVAAPNPVLTPVAMPEPRVRWMHRIAIGPTGTAMENPTSTPAKRKTWFVMISSFVCG